MYDVCNSYQPKIGWFCMILSCIYKLAVILYKYTEKNEII